MKPASITANREKKELAIICDDGHSSLYTSSLMRTGCPHLHLRHTCPESRCRGVQLCAECRSWHDTMGDSRDPSVFNARLPDSPATRIITVTPVGSYGITTFWEDRHATGIYRWEYLRAMYPCAECRK